MYVRATILRPLFSKRAMISPVRPRANASGLTRIRVRSTWFLSWVSAALPLALSFPPALALLAVTIAVPLDGHLMGDGRLVGRDRPPAAARRLRRRRRLHLRLAVRAHLPRRVHRLAARVAALLELAHA